MTTKSNRAIAAATAAAIALTSMTFAPAMAAPASKHPGVTTASDTDFSSVRRKRRSSGDAAAIGAFVGIAGAIAGIAAQQQYRREQRRYYQQPQYYGGAGPYYRGYGGGYASGPRYGNDPRCPGGYYGHRYGLGWGCYN